MQTNKAGGVVMWKSVKSKLDCFRKSSMQTLFLSTVALKNCDDLTIALPHCQPPKVRFPAFHPTAIFADNIVFSLTCDLIMCFPVFLCQRVRVLVEDRGTAQQETRGDGQVQ